LKTKAKAKKEVTNPTEYEALDAARGMNWHKQKSISSGSIFNYPSMGPLIGVTHRKKLVFGKGKVYTVVIHGGYNALGLFGSECNGIGVIDETSCSVLVADHGRQPTGYFGPLQRQIDEWNLVCSFNYEQLREFVNSNPQARKQIP
jgi:hypothetical protein